MDGGGQRWYFSGMTPRRSAIPAYGLYGEKGSFPDVLHCERIGDRASRHDWTIRPHRHGNLHQIFLILGGGATAMMDDRRWPVTGSALLSVPRFVAHGFDFPKGQEGYVLSLPPGSLPDLMATGSGDAEMLSRPMIGPAGEAAGEGFEAILDELADTRPARSAMVKAVAAQIAIGLIRQDGDARSLAPTTPAERHMRAFETLVRGNLRSRLSIAEYAARLGLSADHLGRICRSMTGLSAGNFVESRLMQEARRRLAYTRDPVSAIGYDLGFADPAYFSRVFRRTEGQSPSGYRAAVWGRAS